MAMVGSQDSFPEPWRTTSAVVGWIYFSAWSLSFFPQAFENYNAKNVAGFSTAFALLNPSGFYFYTLYSVGGFVDPPSTDKVDGVLPNEGLGTGRIAPNDLCFAILAFTMSSVQLVQIFIYPRGEANKNIQCWVAPFLIFLYMAIIGTFIAEASGAHISNSWDTLLVAGYCKAAITFVKYLPQVYLNYSRQSTVGWSLANVMLDLTGGTLSMAQIMIDGFGCGKALFKGEGAFNVVKFMLSVMSIIFDSIFLFQHYVLYRSAWVKARDDKNKTALQIQMEDQQNQPLKGVPEDRPVNGTTD